MKTYRSRACVEPETRKFLAYESSEKGAVSAEQEYSFSVTVPFA